MKQRHINKHRGHEIKKIFPDYITDHTNRLDQNFVDFYEDISDDWEYKAKRLQARRWRKIKNQQAF